MEDPRPNTGGPSALTGPTSVSRRTVVLGVSAVGAAGLLTACGGSGGGSSSTGTGDSSAGASSSSATEDSGGGGGSSLAKTADVSVGGGVINKSAKVVVTQPSAGTYKGFTAVCTHQSCLVGEVKDNVIVCPCHGSMYSATDGSVKGGPAPSPLTAVPVKVEGAEIVKA